MELARSRSGGRLKVSPIHLHALAHPPFVCDPFQTQQQQQKLHQAYKRHPYPGGYKGRDGTTQQDHSRTCMEWKSEGHVWKRTHTHTHTHSLSLSRCTFMLENHSSCWGQDGHDTEPSGWAYILPSSQTTFCRILNHILRSRLLSL